MKQDNSIGILLDSTGISKVGKVGLAIFALLWASVELGSGNDRNI
jgi:hypothetical protein